MGAGSAAIALRRTFGEPAIFQGVLSFLDDSSQVCMCSANATDIATMADLNDELIDEYTDLRNGLVQADLYRGSFGSPLQRARSSPTL